MTPAFWIAALHRVLRDLVKEHATDRERRRAALRRDLRRHVLRDRLAFAIRIGRDEDFAARPSPRS